MKELNLVTLQEFSLSINIADNPLNLNINDYLEVALRNNKKRRFLFVSKTLGKHLKVAPEKVDELGKTLAKAYIKKFGNIKVLPFIIFFTAYLATCLLSASAMLNFTSATLLKFVFTGPGHKALIFTFDFCLNSSCLMLCVSLTT